MIIHGGDGQLDGDDGHASALALRPRRKGRRGDRQLVAQDASLELPDLRTGLQAELVDQPPAQLLVGVQRVGLPSGAVLRRHQLTGEGLVQRVDLDRLLELGDDLPRPSADLPLEQLVHRSEATLVELHRAGNQGAAVAQVDEGIPSPVPEGVPQQTRGAFVVDLRRCSSHAGLEGVGVDGQHGRVQPIAGGLTADGLGGIAECPPQPGHVHLDGLARPGLWSLRPQPVDQVIHRNDPPAPRGEEAEHEALLRTTERDPNAVVDKLHRPQDSRFHRRQPYSPRGTALTSRLGVTGSRWPLAPRARPTRSTGHRRRTRCAD